MTKKITNDVKSLGRLIKKLDREIADAEQKLSDLKRKEQFIYKIFGNIYLIYLFTFPMLIFKDIQQGDIVLAYISFIIFLIMIYNFVKINNSIDWHRPAKELLEEAK